MSCWQSREIGSAFLKIMKIKDAMRYFKFLICLSINHFHCQPEYRILSPIIINTKIQKLTFISNICVLKEDEITELRLERITHSHRYVSNTGPRISTNLRSNNSQNWLTSKFVDNLEINSFLIGNNRMF